MNDNEGRSLSSISPDNFWGGVDEYLVVRSPGWADPETKFYSDEAEAYACSPNLAYRPLLPPGEGTSLDRLDASEWVVVGGAGEVFAPQSFRVFSSEDFGDPDAEMNVLEHSAELFDWALVPGVADELKTHFPIVQLHGVFDAKLKWVGLYAKLADGWQRLDEKGNWLDGREHSIFEKMPQTTFVEVNESKVNEVIALVRRAQAGGTVAHEFFTYWANPDPEPEPEFNPIEMGLRLLSAVAFLHEQGQHNLRVLTGLSGSGMYWRLHLCPASNAFVEGERLELTDWKLGFSYSTGDEWLVAGTKTSPSTSIEELARLIGRAAGTPDNFAPDPAYVSWFKELSETAKKLKVLPVGYSDFHQSGFELGSNVVFKLPPAS